MWFEWGCAMGPALWPQRWELSHSHPIGMKVWYECTISPISRRPDFAKFEHIS